jgi:hypothetical protein
MRRINGSENSNETSALSVILRIDGQEADVCGFHIYQDLN